MIQITIKVAEFMIIYQKVDFNGSFAEINKKICLNLKTNQSELLLGKRTTAFFRPKTIRKKNKIHEKTIT